MELNEKIHNYRLDENEYECLNVELFTNSNGFY